MYDNVALSNNKEYNIEKVLSQRNPLLDTHSMHYSRDNTHPVNVRHLIKNNDFFISDPFEVLKDYINSIDKRPLFIGIDGGSCAGKTFFVKKLVKRLAKSKIHHHVIKMDYYVIGRKKRLPPSEKFFDMKKWFKLDQINQDLEKIRKGEKTLFIPNYDHKTGRETKKIKHTIKKNDIVLVEGMYSLDDSIRRHLDLSVLIHTNSRVRLQRELIRNKARVDETPIYIKNRFILASDPSYKKHFRQVNPHANIIIDNNDHNQPKIIHIDDHVMKDTGLSRFRNVFYS
ncbi:MAG: P-loop NTPase fold protein [Methanobacteriota archaeon]